jgi:hypothetical protein
MPADITLTGNLTGLSTVGGNLGPAGFSYTLNDAEKFYTQEIAVPVSSGAPVVHNLPAVGTQRLFYLKTTQDVILTINAEPQGTLLAAGLYVRAGMADVTQITIDGNGATAGVVYLVVVGT